MAKILVYDLETGPNLAYVWGKYQQDVLKFTQEWELLSFAYKWLGEKESYVIGRNTHSEQHLVTELYKLFNEADILIAHNGDRFDQKMANVKFLQYNFSPPSYYKSIDTLKVAKRYFRFNSNKLDDLGSFLNLGRKVETGGFGLWLGCLNNDPKSWRKMLRYNKQDVLLLEKVYLKLRPWIENHPGINIIDGRPHACPKCGKGPLQSRGERHTKVSKYTRYQCTKCKGWSNGRLAIKTDMQFVN